MGDNSGENADLKTTVETLVNAVKLLQVTVDSNAQAIAALTADRSSSSSSKHGSGEHHNDRPPRFQKMDFSSLRWEIRSAHLHQQM